MGSPVPAARVPLSGLLSGCSSGTHNPPLCMLSPLGYLGSFPRRRKFRLEQNNSTHRCGHTSLQCPGPCPPAPTRCATQGRRGITQAVSRPGWQQGAWKQGVMEGHHGFTPRYGTACHKRECPEPLRTQNTPGHGGQARALQQGAPRGTGGEKPRSPGTSACSLPQQGGPMLAGSTVGPAPAGTSLKATSRAHIARLSPMGTVTASPGEQPGCLARIPSPGSPHWGQCLASPLHP